MICNGCAHAKKIKPEELKEKSFVQSDSLAAKLSIEPSPSVKKLLDRKTLIRCDLMQRIIEDMPSCEHRRSGPAHLLHQMKAAFSGHDSDDDLRTAFREDRERRLREYDEQLAAAPKTIPVVICSFCDNEHARCSTCKLSRGECMMCPTCGKKAVVEPKNGAFAWECTRCEARGIESEIASVGWQDGACDGCRALAKPAA